MSNPPRIWLDYRPVRIGWVIPDRDIALFATAVSWSTCLWGGRYNCMIPAYDAALADRLLSCFGADVLLPVHADAATTAFIARHLHLQHERWRDSMFQQHRCEFVDIRHALRRIVAHQDKEAQERLRLPEWQVSDQLHPLFAAMFGIYPAPGTDIADYRTGVQDAFKTPETLIPPNAALPPALLDGFSPLALTGYDLRRANSRRRGWLGPGVVLGSAADFDTLVMFWNLRAAGARLIFYDQSHSARLKDFATAFLSRYRGRTFDEEVRINFWIRHDRTGDDSWKPDLELEGLPLSLSDGRGDLLWNGMNIEPGRPQFSAWHRDVVPSYAETEGRANASFALPDRPFNEDDTQALNQKFAVVVDAQHYGEPNAELTFETPFVPRLNEFYGRHFHHDYDGARSQIGHLNKGAVAIITPISSQRLQIDAFRVLDWLKAFFALCQIDVVRSEAGLRCSRLIAQLGGLQSCRVFKIRGVRNLLRKYGVEQSFTRGGALEALRDVDSTTRAVGFDAFKTLHIEYREKGDLKPDDVLRYLLERRVFRAGLEFTCPNCQLPSWIHLDDVKTNSICAYCDHHYDVTPQLKDRDWRYRRSGIFGRDDHQLGGVPVALTLQQLSTSLHDNIMMYSTALSFLPAGATIEPCESDFLAVVSGALAMSESPVQLVFGEAKTERAIDAQDVRKLGKLADAVPSDLAQAYILFSKTVAFTSDEIALTKTLNTQHRRRVILWSREELEPYFVYERSKAKLGDKWHAVSLANMAEITRRLYFV
jgi:hypothetical protein